MHGKYCVLCNRVGTELKDLQADGCSGQNKCERRQLLATPDCVWWFQSLSDICGLSSLKSSDTNSLLFRRQCLTFMVASLASIHLSAAVWKTHCHRISLTVNGVFPVWRLAHATAQQHIDRFGVYAVNENSSLPVSLQDPPGRRRHLLLVLCPLAAKDGERRR